MNPNLGEITNEITDRTQNKGEHETNPEAEPSQVRRGGSVPVWKLLLSCLGPGQGSISSLCTLGSLPAQHAPLSRADSIIDTGKTEQPGTYLE